MPCVCVCTLTRVYRGTLGVPGHLLLPKMHLHGDISEKVSRDSARETVAQTAAGTWEIEAIWCIFSLLNETHALCRDICTITQMNLCGAVSGQPALEWLGGEMGPPRSWL